jgi:glycosyltransferase involved in cell wall biosynthesis
MLATRLLKDKGAREFAEAAKLLLADPDIGPGWVRVVLVGSPDPEDVTSLATETLDSWQSECIVELWGSRSDIAEAIGDADIVVLPSYRKGMPKVLLEAAACGKAIVTSDVPGYRHAILPGHPDLLVKVRDSASLAEGIKRLLVDEDTHNMMGGEGRKLALERFGIQPVAETHLALYAKLIVNGQSGESLLGGVAVSRIRSGR